MSNTLIRLLKFAEILSETGDVEAFNSFCLQFQAFLKKNELTKIAHFEPVNDGTTPSMWRKNLDYGSWESSPYYGNVSDFIAKFPGGIKDWLKYRNDSKKERFQLWDINKIKERKAQLEILMKDAHFEPIGPDNTEDFSDEPHLFSGDENVGGFESIKKYLEEKRKASGQDADDAARDAARDFVNYYKLLLKGKKRRGKK